MEKDLIIIGGGPGGYVAAIRAAQLGVRVVLVEKDQLGGTCLSRGCIPTKALYQNARVINTLNNVSEYGIQMDGFSINMSQIQHRKQDIVQRLIVGIGQLIKANNIELVTGSGRLVDRKTVAVTEPSGNVKTIKAKHILLATGSIPAKPPIPGLDLPGVMTSDEMLEMVKIPTSIVIIGGGVIGIEFAWICHAMGTEVTVLEFMPQILPAMDCEIVKRLTMALKKQGIKVETGVKVKEVRQQEHGLTVLAEGKKGDLSVAAETVLVSTGRAINVEGLNLNGVGVEYDHRGIKIDEKYATNVPGIYAIGDVIGGQMLAHVASDEGKAAVEHIMGLKGHVNYTAVPGCVFSFPEMASVGLTEEQAKKQNLSYLVSKFMFGANGKALTMGEGEGLVKVIAGAENKEILGVHILGPHASDLIPQAVLAVEHKFTAEEITRTMHAHPTLAETFLEAVAGLEQKAIHIAPRKI